MPMNNPFHTPAFSMAALTVAINLLPNRYGRLEALNLFPIKPVRQRQLIVEERNGVLNLLPTLPPGSPGTVGRRGKRTDSRPACTPAPPLPRTRRRAGHASLRARREPDRPRLPPRPCRAVCDNAAVQ